MSESQTHRYCDYEGSDYRTAFWGGRDREYEDAAERIALGRLLPPSGGRLIEIGAGFGRLADLYAGYREVVLLDPEGKVSSQHRCSGLCCSAASGLSYSLWGFLSGP